LCAVRPHGRDALAVAQVTSTSPWSSSPSSQLRVGRNRVPNRALKLEIEQHRRDPLSAPPCTAARAQAAWLSCAYPSPCPRSLPSRTAHLLRMPVQHAATWPSCPRAPGRMPRHLGRVPAQRAAPAWLPCMPLGLSLLRVSHPRRIPYASSPRNCRSSSIHR
jgi:hypothetical protein